MKKMMNTVTRATAIAIMAVVLFAGNAMASEKVMGTIEMTAEMRAEALAEKALATKSVEIENEEAEAENFESPVEFEEAEIEVVEFENKEIEVVETKEEAKEVVIEATEEVEAEVETADEFVEEDEMEMIAEIASTADGVTANNEVKTIDAATAAASTDGVVVEFGNTETKAAANTTAAKVANTTTKKATDVNAKYLGTTAGKKRAITLIGDSTFRDINKLQAAIDANNIVCYPTADMTKGVKYMAGHNPGAMSHIAGLKVGSVVRLSNDEGHQDYQIKEIKTGSGSFATVTFNTANGVKDAWTMIRTGAENAVIIQYCVNGVNTLHYGVAI